MVEEVEVYRALQRHMDTFPIRFPEREGGAEIRLLKRLFTPQEAKIATKLKWSVSPSETLDIIYPRLKNTGISKEELEETLDEMAKKGLICYQKDGETKYYANAMWAVGILEFQVDKLTKALVTDMAQFYKARPLQEIQRTGIGQLRTIPVGQSIRREDSVANYDNVRQLINKSNGPFILINCVCRQTKDIVNEPCKATDRRDLCIGIGDFTKQYLDLGWGREVSKEEILETIRQNENEGLILQPSNSQDIKFLCSCCGCCCLGLVGVKGASRPVDYFTTNYYAEVDADSCSNCGTCVDVCQMDAVTLTNNIASISLDRCIGCGVCVANCPSEAVSLVKKEKEHVPPKTFEDLYAQIEQRRRELEKATK
ncbi:MAG: ATP-binding protein [Candidatus Hodarchaeota archaeon]